MEHFFIFGQLSFQFSLFSLKKYKGSCGVFRKAQTQSVWSHSLW